MVQGDGDPNDNNWVKVKRPIVYIYSTPMAEEFV